MSIINKLFPNQFKSLLFIFALPLLTSCSLLNIFSDQDQRPYYRVWSGFKKSNLTLDQFKIGLQDSLVPQTVVVGENKGLANYLVVLPKINTLPDEFALIVYESQEKYKLLRSTTPGQKYADLHWDFFDKSNSKSAEALFVTPQTKIEFDIAYDVVGKNVDWSKNLSRIKIIKRKPLVSDAQYLASLERILKAEPRNYLLARIVLVKMGYAIFYDNIKKINDESLLAYRALLDKEKNYLQLIAEHDAEQFKKDLEFDTFYLVK